MKLKLNFDNSTNAESSTSAPIAGYAVLWRRFLLIKHNINMKIKAIHTKWNNKPCVIKPIFFPKETGLQFTVIQGSYKGSLFACTCDQFTFDRYAKFQIFLVKIWYYIKMNLWRKLRHQWPYRIKLFFNPIQNDGFPF